MSAAVSLCVSFDKFHCTALLVIWNWICMMYFVLVCRSCSSV